MSSNKALDHKVKLAFREVMRDAQASPEVDAMQDCVEKICTDLDAFMHDSRIKPIRAAVLRYQIVRVISKAVCDSSVSDI